MADEDKKSPKAKLSEEPEVDKTPTEEDTDVITVKTASDEDKTESDTDKTPEKEESLEKPEVEKEEEDVEKEKPKETSPQKKVTSFSLIDSNKSKDELGVEESKSSPIISEAKDTMEEKPKNETGKEEISQNEVNKWIENYDEVNKPTQKGEKKGFKVFLIILLVLSFLAILAGGFIYYQKNISNKSGKATPTETPKPQVTTAAESPTPEASEVSLSDYNVQVLNGSGIPGEAGNAKDLLSDLDFNKVDTGNADNYDYTDTEVSLKEDVPNQVYDDIKDKLDSTYTVVKSDSSVLDSSSYDVIIIVGTKK
jgi:hypothetical protein